MKLKWIALGPSFLCFMSGCSSFSGRSFDVEQIKYGSADFEVSIAKYSDTKYSEANPTSKSLIIMPPTGGENIIDRSYAKKFCRAGYDVYIIQTWSGKDTNYTIDLDIHQSLYEKAQKAISLTLDQIKSPYIGLLGTSAGALHSAVSASTQSRINSVFIIVGGAPIPEVIATSDQDAMKDLRKGREEKYGFKTTQEYIEALNQKFHLEPTKLGESFKTKNLGMAIALQDETVPTATQNKLRDFWQPKTVITLNSSHFWGIVKTWLFEDDAILNFFNQKF